MLPSSCYQYFSKNFIDANLASFRSLSSSSRFFIYSLSISSSFLLKKIVKWNLFVLNKMLKLSLDNWQVKVDDFFTSFCWPPPPATWHPAVRRQACLSVHCFQTWPHQVEPYNWTPKYRDQLSITILPASALLGSLVLKTI